MKRRCTSLLAASLPVLLLSIIVSPAAAVDKEAAQLLPPTTIMYAHISQPKRLMDVVLDHPLRARLEEVDEYKQAIQSKQYVDFQIAVAIIESQLGMKWRPALEKLTAGGIYAAFDPSSDGLALLVQSEDAASLDKTRDTFLNLARQEAKRKDKPDPVTSGEYRGVTAYQVDEVKFATFGKWLLATNKSEMGKALIDRLLDDDAPSLAEQPRFKEAQAKTDTDASMWMYIDVEAVRKSGEVKPLNEAKTDNPGAELLVGGLLDNLKNTPYIVGTMDLQTRHFGMSFASPHDTSWVGESREYFFGPGGKGAAPPLVKTARTMLSVSTYRDISQMWLRADDLFEQNVVDELAKADSNLSTLFAGRDFGEEILGAIAPELQFVLGRQDFGDRTPRPAIQLPEGALVTRLRDPGKMRDELRRTFVSLIGFLNVVGSMNGQPQLDFDIDKQGEDQIITTRYLPEDDEKDSKRARINFNFSPSAVFHKDVMIIASTESLARELLKQADQKPAAASGSTKNTAMMVDFSVLRDVLADNRSQLVAQNMLEEGNSKEEAEQQIGIVLAIADLFRDASMNLAAHDGLLEMKMDINLK